MGRTNTDPSLCSFPLWENNFPESTYAKLCAQQPTGAQPCGSSSEPVCYRAHYQPAAATTLTAGALPARSPRSRAVP